MIREYRTIEEVAGPLMLVRQVLAADVKDAPLPPWKLGGMDAEEVHRGSHHPEAFGLSGHLLPAPEQGLLAAQMNRLRAVCREAELAGIAAWQDAVEMLLAGATALQIGTVLFTDPYAPVKILDGLNRFLDEEGLSSVTELTGGIRPW